MATTPMALETEIEYFEKNKDRLLAEHAGKFAVILNNELLGTYDSLENAYTAGVEAYGDRQFLVRKVSMSEPDLTNLALMHGLIHANH